MKDHAGQPTGALLQHLIPGVPLLLLQLFLVLGLSSLASLILAGLVCGLLSGGGCLGRAGGGGLGLGLGLGRSSGSVGDTPTFLLRRLGATRYFARFICHRIDPLLCDASQTWLAKDQGRKRPLGDLRPASGGRPSEGSTRPISLLFISDYVASFKCLPRTHRPGVPQHDRVGRAVLLPAGGFFAVGASCRGLRPPWAGVRTGCPAPHGPVRPPSAAAEGPGI